MVRQRPAKPLCPSSNLGGASNKAASLYETCRFFFAISSVCFHFPGTPVPGFSAFIWKAGKCCAKRWTVAFSSLPGGKLQTKRKDTKEKTSVSFGAEGETRRALPCLFAARTIPFYVPFCCAKRWTVEFSSLPGGKLQAKRKDTKEKTSVSFGAEGETRRALPCLFAARTIPFYVTFCCAKRWTVEFSSLPGGKLQTKKDTKEKTSVSFVKTGQ